jgi:uncharacterized DUF497 family protein
MKIVWDEPKRQANLQKHRLDFADIGEFDWANAVVEDARPDASGRRRLKALGYFRDGTATVIFMTLGREAVSIISSARRATGKEGGSHGQDHKADAIPAR